MLSIVHGQYVSLKLHPIYFTDDVTPRHPIWHAAYVGFQYSPELYGFPVARELLGADSTAYDGAMRYLQSMHFIPHPAGLTSYQALEAGGYFSEWNGNNPKYGLHDRIMRSVVFQIVRQHPLKVIYLMAVRKPVAIARVCASLIRRAHSDLKRFALAGGLIAGLFLIAFGGRGDLLELGRLLPVGLGAVMAALLPSFWAYPIAWSLADSALLTLGIAVAVVGLSLAAAYWWAVFATTGRRESTYWASARNL